LERYVEIAEYDDAKNEFFSIGVETTADGSGVSGNVQNVRKITSLGVGLVVGDDGDDDADDDDDDEDDVAST